MTTAALDGSAPRYGARAEAGNVVPFVLMFNFGAGFAYVLGGLATSSTATSSTSSTNLPLDLDRQTKLDFGCRLHARFNERTRLSRISTRGEGQ